jgi:ABC-2 type transport system ATP-binding protein
MNAIIDAKNISKQYDGNDAVKNLNLSVNAGEVVGLLGPNGAGKTTTVKMLATLIEPQSGSITINGFDVVTQPNAVRKIIGLAGQSAAIDDKLTTRENLSIFGSLYGIDKATLKERAEMLIERFDLRDFADRPASTYSGGQRRRLDLIAALIANPKALFLDEPTTGLDPRSRNTIWKAIQELTEEGTAVVLTTQYLEEADQLADRIIVIDKGRTIASGTPDSLKRALGNEILDVYFDDDQNFAKARGILAENNFTRDINEDAVVHIPLSEGAKESLKLLRKLDDAGITISDFNLRKPTLDDVFLTLTDD